jgi:hypothetical protein
MKLWIRFVLVMMGLLPRAGGAQTTIPSTTFPLGLPTATAPVAGQHAVLASVALVAGAVLVLLAIGKVHDFWSKRKEQAEDLESRINGALFEHLIFLRTSIAPSVRIPFRRNAPVTIALRGEVPSSQLELTALRLVEEAASRVRSDYVVENHMTVGSSLGSGPGIVPGEARKTDRLVGAFKTVVSVVGAMAGVLLVKYAVLIEYLHTR